MKKDGVRKSRHGIPNIDTDNSLKSKIINLKPKSNAYIIAEIGFNHLGNYNLAKKMILEAKNSGAQAAKLQTFIPTEMVFKNSPHFKLINNTSLSQENYYNLKKLCEKIKIDFISTPFDLKSLDLLNKIKIHAIKVASMDLNNMQLLSKIRDVSIPVILSTGMSAVSEIKKSYEFLNKRINKIYLLHCISKYPTKINETNLGFLDDLKRIAGWKIGFSDHTVDEYAGIISIVKGAKIIEKHFTIDNKLPGADNKISLNPKNMKKFVNKIRETEIALNNFSNIKKRIDLPNQSSFRRFIFAKENIMQGERIDDSKISILRSSKSSKKLTSVSKYLEIINRKARKEIKKFSPIYLESIKK